MRSFRAGVPFLLLMVAFSGCSGGSTDGASLGAPQDDAEEGVLVTGLVVDEEFLPVEAAVVAIPDRGAQTQTDATGFFTIGPVAPDEYELVVEKPGYAPNSTLVRAQAGGSTPVTIVLTPTAPTVPYHVTELHVTFVICASRNLIGGTPCTKLADYALGTNVSGQEKFAYPFLVPYPGLVDVLVEMDWSPQQLGKDMLFMVQTPPNQPLTAATVKYFAMEGGRPLRGWMVAGVENGEGRAAFDAEPNKVTYEGLTIWSYDNSTVPFTSLYLNHRTDTWMTFFYNRAGPRDYTALPVR